MNEQKPLIYVIDDDSDSLEIASRILEKGGLRVLGFSDPADALKEMETRIPDMIVSDLMMDSLHSGFAFSNQVKSDEKTKHVPIVMMTAAGGALGFDFGPRGSEDLKAMNVDAFFNKPLRSEPFLAKIWELLSRSRTERGG